LTWQICYTFYILIGLKNKVMVYESEDEIRSKAKDISSEFLEMEVFDFLDYTRTLSKEPALSITIDWKDLGTARRLKAFIEQGRGQRRFVTIRATEEQHSEAPNEFSSGINWEKI
jgi:hypothetical protein